MEKNLLHAFMAFLFLGVACFQVGCNTTRGAGRDIEKAGDTIEDAAEEAADEID